MLTRTYMTANVTNKRTKMNMYMIIFPVSRMTLLPGLVVMLVASCHAQQVVDMMTLYKDMFVTILGPGARQHRAAAPGPHPPAAPPPASHILPDHSCRRWNI